MMHVKHLMAHLYASHPPLASVCMRNPPCSIHLTHTAPRGVQRQRGSSIRGLVYSISSDLRSAIPTTRPSPSSLFTFSSRVTESYPDFFEQSSLRWMWHPAQRSRGCPRPGYESHVPMHAVRGHSNIRRACGPVSCEWQDRLTSVSLFI